MPQADVVDALRRTRLANERTYLAWLRTALTALAVAVGTGKIVPNVADVTPWPFELLGAGFAGLAFVFIALGIRRFLKVEAALDVGAFSPLARNEALAVAAIASTLALATLVLVFVR
jgi:inner membrane protein YidH